MLGYALPKVCPICREREPTTQGLCGECHASMNLISGAVCYKCGGPLMTEHSLCRECINSPRIWWNKAVSAFRFEGGSRTLVHKFKYHGDVATLPFIAQSCKNAWEKQSGALEVDCIVPVPLHWIRRLKRGYNQTELVCNELSKCWNVPTMKLLRRVKHTQPQARLSKNKRKKNLNNAFAVREPKKVRDKSILLMDDVMTTGTTLAECAAKLVKDGAKQVNVLTIARRI